jgi:hypothetical protein
VEACYWVLFWFDIKTPTYVVVVVIPLNEDFSINSFTDI